jgi:hypothetical protein
VHLKTQLGIKTKSFEWGGISKMGPLTLAQLAKINLALKVGI